MLLAPLPSAILRRHAKRVEPSSPPRISWAPAACERKKSPAGAGEADRRFLRLRRFGRTVVARWSHGTFCNR
jgi:hypothetical protein